MKKAIVSIMATTGAVLVVLTIFAIIFGSKSISVHTILEVLAANTVIIFGLLFTRKFESSYAILAYFIDISFILAVLITFGVIFDWFSSIPVWVLVIIGILVYIFDLFTNLVRMRNEIKEMDELLQKRKEKNNDIVT